MNRKKRWCRIVQAGSGILRASTLIFLILIAPVALHAQRTNELTGEVNVGGAIDDNPFVDRGGLSAIIARDFGWALNAYPSVGVISSTSTSRFTLDYTFGFEQYQSTVDLRSESHRIASQFEADLSSRWKLRMGDNFTRSPDFTSFMAFRGFIFTPEGLLFDIVPVALRRNSNHNTANLGLDWDASSSSSLSFDIHHSIQQFQDAPGFYPYSDYQRYGAAVQYKNKVNARTAWTLSYRAEQLDPERFQAGRNHDVLLGVEREVRPSLSIHLRAGPSYLEARSPGESPSLVTPGAAGDPLESFLGYNADLGITHSSPSTTVRLFYRHDNGTNSGIGSVSSAHNLGVDFSRRLVPRLTLRFMATGYDFTRQLDTLYDHRGIMSTLQFDVALTRYSALTIGSSYQSQRSDYDLWDLERRRLFFSIRFFLPDSKRTTG